MCNFDTYPTYKKYIWKCLFIPFPCYIVHVSDRQRFNTSSSGRACILGRLCSILFFVLWGAIRGPWHHKTWSTLKGRGGSVASGTLAETPAVVVWCGVVGGLEASDVWEKLEGRGTHKCSDNTVEICWKTPMISFFFFFFLFFFLQFPGCDLLHRGSSRSGIKRKFLLH